MLTYYLWPTKFYLQVLILVLLLVSISACGNHSATVSTQNNSGTGIPIPQALTTTLPGNGILSAYLRVDGGPRQQMAIDGSTATITLTGVTAGQHDFTIEFEFTFTDHQSPPLMLASAKKTMVIVDGQKNSLDFTGTAYDTNFDTDQDGISNLTELTNNTDPYSANNGYGVTVTVSGYTTGNDMVLQNNNSDDLLVASDGTYKFSSLLPDQSTYSVTIATPLSQLKTSCSVVNGGGVIQGQSVAGIQVNCSDNIAPNIISISPSLDAVDADPKSAISAKFDENMLAKSITTDSLSLTDLYTMTKLNISAANYNSNDRVVSYVPDQSLALLRTYSAELSPGITDLSGQALVSSPWSFTTRDGSWGTSNTIDVGSLQQLTIYYVYSDPKGNCMVVWRQPNGSGQNIISSSYDVSTGKWGAPQNIQINNTDSLGGVSIDFDSNGNGLAVWTTYNSTTTNIWANRHIASTGTWGVAKLLSSNVYDPTENVHLRLDQNGNGIARWVTAGSTWISNFGATLGTWGTPQLLDTGGDTGYVIDDAGDMLKVYIANDGTWDSVYAKYYDASSNTWSTAQLIETDNNGSAENLDVAIDPSGNAIAVWDLFDDGVGIHYLIAANHFDATTKKWGTEQVVANDYGAIYRYPRVSLDESGNGIVTWYPMTDASRFYVNRYDALTGKWGAEKIVGLSAGGNLLSWQIQMGPQGNAFGVWWVSGGGEYSMYVSRYNSQLDTWGTPYTLFSNTTGQGFGQIGIDSKGYGLFVWYNDNPSTQYYFKRFE